MIQSRAFVCLSVLLLLWSTGGAGAAERPATVLLITSEKLAQAWQPLADWKTRQGKATRILTVEEIRKAYKGADVQQKIRAAVLDHVDEHGTRWVVLGGDSQPNGGGLVPDRDTPHRVMGGRLAYDDVPTDLYYISPKNWDANGDGIYGQWPQDRDAIAYTHPMGVAIGRIPVRTAGDVAAYTRKIVAYESRYPEKNFARKLIYTNTVNASEPKVRRSWDDYISPSWSDGSVLR
ncbi:MAG: C25 family cysteine peptidase, partial [Phycisphaeraceae bacterium]|nr:C25 family cysteine peptidase [Phycisphaeraceae bacterium]